MANVGQPLGQLLLEQALDRFAVDPAADSRKGLVERRRQTTSHAWPMASVNEDATEALITPPTTLPAPGMNFSRLDAAARPADVATEVDATASSADLSRPRPCSWAILAIIDNWIGTSTAAEENGIGIAAAAAAAVTAAAMALCDWLALSSTSIAWAATRAPWTASGAT